MPILTEKQVNVNDEYILESAMLAVQQGGISLVPVGNDKRPTIKWKVYQEKIASEKAIIAWLSQGAKAFAAVCGAVSGGLEIIDFDDNPDYSAQVFFDAWRNDPNVIAVLDCYAFAIQRTGGGGYQVAYRCPRPDGNQKLAWIPDDTQVTGRSVAIETRGEGGYALIAPSLHPSGNYYTMIEGDFANVPTITQDERNTLIDAAKRLDLMPLTKQDIATAKRSKAQSWNGQTSVIEAYNQAYNVRDLLLQHGYTEAHSNRLSRPGQPESAGVYVMESDNIAFCWSSNDPLHRTNGAGNPLPVDPFDVFTYFDHGGDFKSAVKDAANRLGIPPERHESNADGNNIFYDNGIDPTVEFTANILKLTIDAGHPIDDLKNVVARLSDNERNSLAVIEQLSRVIKKPKELSFWLKSCGHFGEKSSDALLTRLRRLDYKFTLNSLEDEIEVNDRRLDDVTRSEIHLAMMDDAKTYVDDAINVLASENRYHPIQRYLTGLQWDGDDHLAAFLRHIDCDGPFLDDDDSGYPFSLSHALIIRWMLGCVARGLDGGQSKAFKHQTPMMVFVGGQGAGKSSLIKWLASGVGFEYHQEGAVNPSRDEDKRSMVTKWIWEVAELGATLRKSDRESMKSFITTEWHTYRKPYARSLITRPTLCNLAGTINGETGFLDDPTGHRRFLPVQVKHIDWRYATDVDVNQLWAQIVYLYENGETPELSQVEKSAMGEVYKHHEVENPLQTYVQMYFDVVPGNENLKTHTAEIIQRLKAFDVSLSHSEKVAGKEINDALAPLGLSRKFVSINGVKGWGWFGIAPNVKNPPH